MNFGNEGKRRRVQQLDFRGKKIFLIKILHENSCWVLMKNVLVSDFLKAISL
ncbi:MAG: hypothetical protein ACQEU4_14735 [Bacillota bacterium]